MKGDFTRNSFKPEKHFSGVRQQQGRVQLDADWNEQIDVQTHLERTTNADLIGASGAPHTGGGFEVGVAAGNTDLALSPGRMYVDGILCALEAKAPSITYLTQPDFPNPAPLNAAAGRTDLVYLDVWERLITAVEDPSIREVALGGPDTATRTQIVWQVKTSPGQPAGVTCMNAGLPQPGQGRLTTQLQELTPPTNPCTLGPAGGYRGLENHLYRVEIHTGGNLGGATFKWSRENGSVVFAIDEFVTGHPEQVRIKSLGKDQILGLKIGDWVEVLDDRAELQGPTGTLAKINDITPHPDGGFVLELSANVAAHASPPVPAPFTHPKLRRWDQVLNFEADGSVKTNASAATLFDLEHGLQVKFSGSDFHAGDYWTFSARATDGSFEKLIDAPPHEVAHHYCPLALITWLDGAAPTVHDCRPEFPSLTELTSFFVAGGDGQEAIPGNALPELLQVGVTNGQWPVSGARVRLQAEAGGKLATNPAGLAAGSDTLDITTGANGIASFAWQLAANATAPSQQVLARLLNDDGSFAPNPPLNFTGNLSIASQVSYDPRNCPDLSAAGVKTVQQAIDALCGGSGECCELAVSPKERLDEIVAGLLKRKQFDIRLCLMAGDHVLPEGWTMDAAKAGEEVNLTITGGGLATRLAIEGKPVALRNFNSFVLRDVDVTLADGLTLALMQCGHVEVSGCHLSGITEKAPLVFVSQPDRLSFRANVMAATMKGAEFTPGRVFTTDPLLKLFRAADRREFSQHLPEVAQKLAAMSPAEKKDFVAQTTTMVRQLTARISPTELASYTKLLRAVAVDRADAKAVADRLRDIRAGALRAVPGVALAIGGDAADTTICDNDISGVVSFFGIPGNQGLNADELKLLSVRVNEGLLNNPDSSGVLQFHTNRVSRLTLGDEMIQRLKEAARATGGAAVPGTFTEAFLSRNVIEQGANLFIAKTAAFTANRFEEARIDVANVFTDAAIYVGNAASNDVRLFNFSRVFQVTANLMINIVDV